MKKLLLLLLCVPLIGFGQSIKQNYDLDWAEYHNSDCNIIFSYPLIDNFIVLPKSMISTYTASNNQNCVFEVLDLEKYLNLQIYIHDVDIGVQQAHCGVYDEGFTIEIIDNPEGLSFVNFIKERYNIEIPTESVIFDENNNWSRDRDYGYERFNLFNRDIFRLTSPGMDYDADYYFFMIPYSNRIVCIDFSTASFSRTPSIMGKVIQSIRIKSN